MQQRAWDGEAEAEGKGKTLARSLRSEWRNKKKRNPGKSKPKKKKI
jgi:hypothetical protein